MMPVGRLNNRGFPSALDGVFAGEGHTRSFVGPSFLWLHGDINVACTDHEHGAATVIDRI
jgi:hypothetical protein